MNRKYAAVLLTAAIMGSSLSILGSCEDNSCYVLCEWNGSIALMEEGSEKPLTVYKTPISSLYPADAELIREGIRLKTGEEVTRLIEDLELE